MLGLLLLAQLTAQPRSDSLLPRAAERAPAAGAFPDSTTWGRPQIRIVTAQGEATAWLLRTADSAYFAAAIPDSTPSASDELVLSLDIGGERGRAPGHDDFQWVFRRVLDSSIVYRGRNGRWEAPKDDPDWRLGAARSGGGWIVSAVDGPRGWAVVLRLDQAWLAGVERWAAALAVRIGDDRPRNWYSWPPPPAGVRALAVEDAPLLWVPIAR